MDTFSGYLRRNVKLVIVILVIILIQIACMTGSRSQTESPPPPPTEDVAGTARAVQMEAQATMEADFAMEITEQAKVFAETAQSLQETQSALVVEPPAANVDFVGTLAAMITEEPVPASMEERIRNAKVLLYEDTLELGIGQWIEMTLDRMGIDYTAVGDRSGDFMKYLDSGTDWDLIIVGAENHNAIQGEFWDVILEQSYKKTAIIAEVWYLDLLGGGKIKNFTNECGISYDGNWDMDDSIYWVEPDHPLLNEPNTVLPLLHYNRYWNSNAGDKVRLRSSGDAEILAAVLKTNKTNNGFITVCMEGRTVFQTFCNHDFRQNEIMDLWENYITYTLTNHYKALDEMK